MTEKMTEEELTSERKNAEARARLGAPETLRVHLLLDASRARVAALEGALMDLRDHGTRHDLNPTLMGNEDERMVFLHEWMRSMDDAVREKARAALSSGAGEGGR